MTATSWVNCCVKLVATEAKTQLTLICAAQYKYKVDGQWATSPCEPAVVDNKVSTTFNLSPQVLLPRQY